MRDDRALTRKLQPMMSIVLGVIMVPLGVLSIAMGLSGGVEPVPLGIGVMMLGTYGAVTALSRRGRSLGKVLLRAGAGAQRRAVAFVGGVGARGAPGQGRRGRSISGAPRSGSQAARPHG
jgi:hypothetical protein